MKKRITLKDVAREAGVSYQTVSKVLKGQGTVSPETEARIRAVVRRLGYRPNVRARDLRVQRSHLIGYSWQPEPPDLYNPILEKFLQSLIEAAEQRNHHILTFAWQQDHDRLEEYRNLILSGRIDGLILSSVDFDDARVAYLMDANFPFVAFGRANPDWDFAYVDVDGGDGIRQATEHLLSLGHRRIAVLGWPQTSRTGEDRLQGYRAAMQQAGLVPDPAWIARGENRVAAGAEMAHRLLNAPPARRPTALVCMSDTLAIGAIHAARNLGMVVGRDVSITGFDDTPLIQYIHPPLTTVRQPIWEVGQRIIAMLFDILDGDMPAEHQILLPPRLIVRQSTGEPVVP
ncbi:MAG: LacI family transcriptional regulator [Caldilineae bacterium]|nr:MAG: LacI family transcriptional regulator [Caldilineae bacterium]